MEMRHEMQMRAGRFDRVFQTIFKHPIEPVLFMLTLFTIHWSVSLVLPLPQIRYSIFVSVLTEIQPIRFWAAVWLILDLALIVCVMFDVPRFQWATLIVCVFAWTFTVWSYGVELVTAWPTYSPSGSVTVLYWLMTFWALGRSTTLPARLRRGRGVE
jgi:hypothetical protein